MSDQQAVDAALAWADRNERGEASSYDPYIVSLAQVVREQREYIAGLERRAGVVADGGERDMVVELRRAEDRIEELLDALRPFAENWDMYASDHVSIEGVPYRILKLSVVQEIARAMTKAKSVLSRLGISVVSEFD